MLPHVESAMVDPPHAVTNNKGKASQIRDNCFEVRMMCVETNAAVLEVRKVVACEHANR